MPQALQPPQPHAGVAAFIASAGLLEPGQAVLAAFSGGPDSTALALILRDLGYQVTLCHIDHAMRAGSRDDARRATAAGTLLGLPIEVVRVPVAPRGEAAARRVRYEALEAVSQARGLPAIATGHTLDDEAETVLLRLHRGGTPLGIPPRRGRVVRPLLTMRRRDAAELCRRRGIPLVTDPTNRDETIARNHLRHRVLPGFGDEGVRALAALATRTGLERQRLDASVDRAMEALARPAGARAGAVRLDRRALALLPQPVVAGVLRRELAALGVEASARLVADVASKVLPRTGACLDLPKGLLAWAEPLDVVLGRPCGCAVPEAVTLAVPGRTLLPQWGLEVLVEEVPPPQRFAGGPGEAVLDRQAARGCLELRSRRPGDRYRPLGSPGSRKLQDVLVDLKIPRGARDRIPVLCCGGRIAWVAGHRIDEAFKVTEASEAALAIRLLALAPEPG